MGGFIMLIIDRNKDYYDYLSHIYGVDKKVVYDRRESEQIEDKDIFSMLSHQYRYTYERCKTNSVAPSFLILEYGYVQKLLKVSGVLVKPITAYTGYSFDSFTLECIYTFSNNKHYYNAPISIRECQVNYLWDWRKSIEDRLILTDNYKETITKTYSKEFLNPILSNTSITSIIEPEEIWKEVCNYLSSLNNDKDVSLPMTDKERAETHGFDKHSFRNPIK
jgi:hypothetical protein